MSTREDILANLAKQSYEPYDMPEIKLTPIGYADKVEQFISISQFVGGSAIHLNAGQSVDSVIQSLYPYAKNIASNIQRITTATINPDLIDDPHDLSNIDLSIVKGEFGVAENGCVWIPQQTRQKVVYFIPDYLVILLEKSKIVATMHDAYQLLHGKDYGFGVFISGPSKTADIEQALVVGAHGAKGATVILI